MEASHSVIIKYLVRILQYCLDNLGLEPGIGEVRIRAHERRAEDNGQVLRAHAVDARVLNDAVQMQRQRAQRRVVGVWKVVDDGMQRVTAENFVFVF